MAVRVGMEDERHHTDLRGRDDRALRDEQVVRAQRPATDEAQRVRAARACFRVAPAFLRGESHRARAPAARHRGDPHENEVRFVVVGDRASGGVLAGELREDLPHAAPDGLERGTVHVERPLELGDREPIAVVETEHAPGERVEHGFDARLPLCRDWFRHPWLDLRRDVPVRPHTLEVLARVEGDDWVAVLVERAAGRETAQHVLADVGQHRGPDPDAGDRQLPGDPHGDGQPRVVERPRTGGRIRTRSGGTRSGRTTGEVGHDGLGDDGAGAAATGSAARRRRC